MKIKDYYNAAAGIIFLIIAGVAFTKDQPAIWIVFGILGLVFVFQGGMPLTKDTKKK